LKAAGSLVLSTQNLATRYGSLIATEQDYSSSIKLDEIKYNWDHPEPEHDAKVRIGKFAEGLSAQYPGQTVVLCSHGGPSTCCYQYLSGSSEDVYTGYTAIFALAQKPDGNWETILKGDSEHIKQVS